MHMLAALLTTLFLASATSAPVPNEQVLQELRLLKDKLWTVDQELSKYDIPEDYSPSGPGQPESDATRVIDELKSRLKEVKDALGKKHKESYEMEGPSKREQQVKAESLINNPELEYLLKKYPSRESAVMTAILNPKPVDPLDVDQPVQAPSKREQQTESQILTKNPELADLLKKYPSRESAVMTAILNPKPINPLDVDQPVKVEEGPGAVDRGQRKTEAGGDTLGPNTIALLQKYMAGLNEMQARVMGDPPTPSAEQKPAPIDGQFGEFVKNNDEPVVDGSQWGNKPALDTELGIKMDAARRCQDGDCDSGDQSSESVEERLETGLMAAKASGFDLTDVLSLIQRYDADDRNPEAQLESLHMRSRK